MTNIRQQLTDVFKGLEKTLNQTPVKQQVEQVKTNFQASQTVLYKNQGQVTGGFQQVANTVSDVVNNVIESIPIYVSDQLGVLKLDVSASPSQLKKDASSNRDDLTTITGKTELAADGFLDVVIAAPLPEAMAAVMKNTTNLNGTQVTEIVRNNVDLQSKDDEFVEDIITNVLNNIVGNLFPDLKSANSQLNRTVSSIVTNSLTLLDAANKGFGTLIENTVEQALQPTYKLLRSQTNKGIPVSDFRRIVELVNQNRLTSAARILSQYSNSSIEDLEVLLGRINNKASNQVSESKTPRNLKVRRTDTLVNLWNDATTNEEGDIFSPVIGSEITAEVLNMTRDVTEVIVTFVPQPGSTIQNYHRLHAEQYDIGFNPHFYIGYDAITYRGRPLNIEASSKPRSITNNHYQRSILIAVNINEKSYTHKFAPGQRDKLLVLIKQILWAKPGIQIYSMKDVGWNYEAGQDALDIPLFIKQKTGRENIKNYDPKTQDPLTSEQLANFYARVLG